VKADSVSDFHVAWSCAVALVSAGLLGTLCASAHGASRWLTGPSLEKRLAQREYVAWSGRPLRDALNSFSRAQQVAVFIDRRVDPGQEVELVGNMMLGKALLEVARSRGLGVCRLQSVVYFGPPHVTSRLRTVAELRRDEIRKLPQAVQRKFLDPEPLAWDDFATPRQLLTDLAKEAGVEILNLEQVPHDLWAAADLPGLSLVDRLTLIAGQFDLTFEVAPNGTRVKLVPLPDDVALVRSYPGGQHPEKLARQWAALVGKDNIKVVGGKIYVRGLLEDHERLDPSKHSGGPSVARTDGRDLDKKRFTLTVTQQPVGPLLKQLAAQLQLDLRIDDRVLEESGALLQKRVSFSVKEVTLDGLIRAVLRPTGLRCQRRGREINIRPGK